MHYSSGGEQICLLEGKVQPFEMHYVSGGGQIFLFGVVGTCVDPHQQRN